MIKGKTLFKISSVLLAVLIFAMSPKPLRVGINGIKVAFEEIKASEEVIASPPVSIPLPPNPREEFALKDIFFDFNKYEIRDDARPVLEENAEILKYNSDLRVVIEGYCDSGDTVTVEDSLGEKRAQAAKDYLVTLGIEPQRIKTADKCSGAERRLEDIEKTRGLDRRVHFIPETTKLNSDSII